MYDLSTCTAHVDRLLAEAGAGSAQSAGKAI
jgi:hypothetical protein